MKAKHLFITALLVLQGNVLFSQCISVELSISWQMGYDLFKKDSLVNIPVLNITYRNNCDTDYYFFKVSPRQDGEPMVIGMGSVQWESDNLLERAKYGSRFRYTNQNLNVTMGREPVDDACWWVYSDTIDYRKYFPIEWINFTLQIVYEYYYQGWREPYYNKMTQYEADFKIEVSYGFEPSNVTPEHILGYFNDQFVFLKAGEVHTDSYSLLVFKIIEGCYTFIIDKDAIENYVLDIMGKEIALPAMVGGYHLYSGSFHKNSVTVCFGDK
jgi:hypothetical protein